MTLLENFFFVFPMRIYQVDFCVDKKKKTKNNWMIVGSTRVEMLLHEMYSGNLKGMTTLDSDNQVVIRASGVQYCLSAI